MNIYVGNLDEKVTEQELQTAFAAFGKVDTARLITDRYTSKPRGFGFVEMPNATEANAAIQGMNGKALGGRPLTVNEARPKTEGGPRRDSRGGGGGGGGARW